MWDAEEISIELAPFIVGGEFGSSSNENILVSKRSDKRISASFVAIGKLSKVVNGYDGKDVEDLDIPLWSFHKDRSRNTAIQSARTRFEAVNIEWSSLELDRAAYPSWETIFLNTSRVPVYSLVVCN